MLHHLKTVGSVNLHRHVEGVLTASDLFAIAKRVLPDAYTTMPWHTVRTALSKKHRPSFENFLQRLPTRWMKLIVNESTKQNVSSEIPLRAMFNVLLTKAAKEKINIVEFLASPFALASNELSVESYCHIFRSCVDNHPQSVWAGEKGLHDGRMEVGLKFCIRREQEPESMLLTTEENTLSIKGKRLAHQILRLYQNGSIVGVDMAGDEQREDRRLSHFQAFFAYLTHASIPFTVHAGELPQGARFRDLAYDNLSFAVRHGASRIGHAVRLFDESPRFMSLLVEALEKGIYFELNLTSNQWTGVTPDPTNHPIIRAVRREHSLFRTNAALHQKLLDHITISDDDPVVFGESDTSLADEIETVGKLTDNFGFEKEEFVKHLKDVGQRATLWHRKA